MLKPWDFLCHSFALILCRIDLFPRNSRVLEGIQGTVAVRVYKQGLPAAAPTGFSFDRQHPNIPPSRNSASCGISSIFVRTSTEAHHIWSSTDLIWKGTPSTQREQTFLTNSDPRFLQVTSNLCSSESQTKKQVRRSLPGSFMNSGKTVHEIQLVKNKCLDVDS